VAVPSAFCNVSLGRDINILSPDSDIAQEAPYSLIDVSAMPGFKTASLS